MQTSLAQEALVRIVDEILVQTELIDERAIHLKLEARFEPAILNLRLQILICLSLPLYESTVHV